jgi:CRP/FNR family cyclic AMP-dependent transcriptional regulator
MFSKIPLFSPLSKQELEVLSAHAVTKSYRPNTILVNEGGEGDSLYVIESGRVKVFLSDEQGREIVINVLGPGEYFGEIALLERSPRSASVITTEASRIAIISRSDFEACLAANPGIAFELIRGLIQRLKAATENVKSLALMDVYGRVARLLLQLAEDRDGTLVVPQKLTQQEIADRVGSSREMISRILKELKSGGYIDVEGGQIRILEKLPQGW